MMQQRVNSAFLSILSLVVALIALSYNTWRNEATESNRNVRAAGFEMLREVAHLQLLVDNIHYVESSPNDPIEGWARVNLLISLSQVMPVSVNREAEQLKQVWQEHWSELTTDTEANRQITEANRRLESAILEALKQLS
jgi:hypothetical protein